MPDYRRLLVPGGTVTCTVNLADRRKTTLTDHISLFRAAYAQVRGDRPFETLALCVLPDHLHAIWRLPEGDADYSTRWRLIKHRFTRSLPGAPQGRRQGERGVWQRRFWEHHPKDDAALSAQIDYIHWNPVKHGHVTEMDDWPYSSWHRWKAEAARPWRQPPEDMHL
ncbi:REP-associated tyrosine transposase [Parvularcula oceani]|uniref:REP-associated tyrosine transposase n=1 Tax=Parvularcula oceani TaxID=1247963 RepID=UPI000690754F|nr:transposase [Parvularcula oceani]